MLLEDLDYGLSDTDQEEDINFLDENDEFSELH